MGLENAKRGNVTVVAEAEKNIRLQPLAPASHARIAQRTAALLALLAFGLPAMLTAVLVRLSLGRPLLFRQVRSGLGGASFTLDKFRTMHDLLPDAERETAMTRFIRAVRFDEIPQLWAIFTGDMNFVGPRPLQPSTVAAFGALGIVRCQVRPGLTGWAQVNGNTRLSDGEKLALDIWYIDHRSAALDMRILLLTAATLVRGESVSAKHLASALAHLRSRSDGAAAGARPAPRTVS